VLFPATLPFSIRIIVLCHHWAGIDFSLPAKIARYNIG
jgi:hypothetical protein